MCKKRTEAYTAFQNCLPTKGKYHHPIFTKFSSSISHYRCVAARILTPKQSHKLKFLIVVLWSLCKPITHCHYVQHEGFTDKSTTDFIFTQTDLALLFLFVNLKLMNLVLMQTISSRNMLEMRHRQADGHGEAC